MHTHGLRPKSLALLVLIAICNYNGKCQLGYSLSYVNNRKNKGICYNSKVVGNYEIGAYNGNLTA